MTDENLLDGPSEKKKESRIQSLWRPFMGWQYLIVCLFDFVIAPVGVAYLYANGYNIPVLEWEPITLQSGGLYHIAMGAVTGVTAWSRGKEKINGVAGK